MSDTLEIKMNSVFETVPSVTDSIISKLDIVGWLDCPR